MNQVDLDPQSLAKINSDFVKGMQKQCQYKCIPKYSNGEISAGERNCIDRCVYKYFEANELIKGLYAQDKFNVGN